MSRDRQPSFLVRYGVMGHVGQFLLDETVETTPDRGQTVVIRSARGLELGEVLLPLDEPGPDGGGEDDRTRPDGPRLLRPAGSVDLEQFRGEEQLRVSRFSRCQQILEAAGWPLELIDVEPLLGPDSVVLHYLGPSDLDLSLLRARFRSECDFNVLFERAGSGLDDVPGEPAAPTRDRRCGDCDCSDGGCASRASAPVEHSGCSSCGVSRWLAARGSRD
jgi:hypothetical protein